MLGPRSDECDVILCWLPQLNCWTAPALLGERIPPAGENGSQECPASGTRKLFPVRVRCFGDSICLE